MLRRVGTADAAEFHALRLEAFARHPSEFRIAVEDEAALSIVQVADRLEREFVLGAFMGRPDWPGGTSVTGIVGIGGLSRFPGRKLSHKALLWGMYVREAARGLGIGRALVDSLLAHARSVHVELVQLTVVTTNIRARRLYERSGFTVYGVEADAVKLYVDAGVEYLDEALMAVRLTSPPNGRATTRR